MRNCRVRFQPHNGLWRWETTINYHKHMQRVTNTHFDVLIVSLAYETFHLGRKHALSWSPKFNEVSSFLEILRIFSNTFPYVPLFHDNQFLDVFPHNVAIFLHILATTTAANWLDKTHGRRLWRRRPTLFTWTPWSSLSRGSSWHWNWLGTTWKWTWANRKLISFRIQNNAKSYQLPNSNILQWIRWYFGARWCVLAMCHQRQAK